MEGHLAWIEREQSGSRLNGVSVFSVSRAGTQSAYTISNRILPDTVLEVRKNP